jgi:hypothetical protein
MATPTNLPGSFSVGQVLTAANMNNIRGAFRILQVVSASTTTLASSSSNTYVDTTLSASITPQSTSSLVLVVVSQDIYSSAAANGAGLRIVRGSTTLDNVYDLSYGTNSSVLAHHTLTYLDSPASTSSLTYKTTFNRNNGTGVMYCQPNNNRSSILLFEVSA